MDICNVTYERQNNTTVHVSFPHINELCCVICKLDFIEVHDSSLKSNFHWQTIKCRLLIHLVFDVIASPVSGTENYIFVITHKTLFETGKLERILRYLKLVYEGVRPITNELYKNCLVYTIQTKIAPLWNKVNQYFLQGKEFYNSIEPIRALKLDIFIEEKEVYLRLHANKVKVPCIKLEDYLPPSVMSEFLADPKGYIELSHYKFPFVYVLPSTKKGKLLSVSKEIPTRSSFKDYDQLRRHWKNMYGYSLPKNKDGILYYEIKFLIPRSTIFTYPSLCVAIGPLDIIPNREKELTITDFLSDMLVKLPKICGKQLQISKHTLHNSKTLNANLPSNVLLRSKKLDIPDKNTSGPTSSLQLEFSAKYIDDVKRNIDTASTSLRTQLDTIHQIHNISLCENIRTDLNCKDINENQNEVQSSNTTQISAIQTTIGDCIEAGTSNNSGDNCTITKKETISRYFRIQKSHSAINKEELTQEGKQKHLSLKEKLLKIKSNESNKVALQEMDQNIDLEKMAKNNKLHLVKHSILSNWLKKHSIPHKSKGKKVELINKVLSHMRNTQILKQFRF